MHDLVQLNYAVYVIFCLVGTLKQKNCQKMSRPLVHVLELQMKTKDELHRRITYHILYKELCVRVSNRIIRVEQRLKFSKNVHFFTRNCVMENEFQNIHELLMLDELASTPGVADTVICHFVTS